MKLVNSEKQLNRPLVWLEISKKNLIYNTTEIKKKLGSAKLMAVVKCNAYGLGSSIMAKTIEQVVDCFGVVGTQEAVDLRKSGICKPIINLGVYGSGDAQTLLDQSIIPTVFTYVAVKEINRVARIRSRLAEVYLKVDTGLNRLGIPVSEVQAFLSYCRKLENLKVIGVLSTFTEDPLFDQEQFVEFKSLKEKCGLLRIPTWSIASSESFFLLPNSEMDMVRIGIALFGYYPSEGARRIEKLELTPVSSFKTRVICVKELMKNESLFYRRKYRASGKTRIAVLPIGYSYGLPTNLVNGGEVLIRGIKFPLVGGVSATNAYVDIGNNVDVEANDEVVIFGRQNGKQINLEKVCALTQKSEYEFLSCIPPKVDRVYVD